MMKVAGSQSSPMITNLSNVKKQPKWSLQGKAKEHRPSTTPGPGAYSSSTPAFPSSPKFGFGTSPRDKMNASAVPGPGQYTPHDPRNVSSQAGFGTSARKNAPLVTVPGPGAYSLNSSMGADTPKYSAAPRRSDRAGAGTPGPGAYQPSDKFSAEVRADPKWGFGTCPRDNPKNSQAPGPGTYSSLSNSSGPAYSMAARQQRAKYPDLPGPGAYGAASTQFGY